MPTPAARAGTSDTDVHFERIDGETGVPLVTGDLADLLSVALKMHRVKVPGLKPYDPFLRIRPRLDLATRIPVQDLLSEPVPSGSATLHGDLHVGQFIRDPLGAVWIVDLDDMALGPPEADLANFTAHLATTLDGGVAHWSRHVQTAWQRAGNTMDGSVFTRFLRFALARRHLKLREACRPDYETDVLAYLRETSNFSIR